jgi:hypothetical protein
MELPKIDFTDVNGRPVVPGSKVYVAVHKRYGGCALRHGTVFRIGFVKHWGRVSTRPSVSMVDKDGQYAGTFFDTKKMLVID